MTRKSHFLLAHAALIGRYLHKQTHWEMRHPFTTSLEAEGATSLPLDELAFLGVVIILCAIWRRKKFSRPTDCHKVKLYNQTSASKNSKLYMARQKVLMFRKISEDIISRIQSMSGYIFKAECFKGSRQVNISWFHLLLSGDVELNPGPYTGEDADVKETLLTICDKLLTMEDWDAVVSAVGSLTAQWDDLGRKLGMHRDTLVIIARNNKEITGLCLNDTIAQWLKLNYITDRYSHPSWRSLAEAVVDLNKSLFLKIAGDHEVKDEESITIEKEQPNLNDQAMTSAETVKPKPLLHENTDDKSAKFPWEFIPALTYPGLQLKDNFNKEQSEKYEVKLEQHSQEMIKTFNNLMYDFYKCMISKNVPVSELKIFLRGLGRQSTIFKDETDQPTISKNLMKAQTIDDMMLIIQSYCSFFNFSLIETMVDKFEQLYGFKLRLEQYKEAFAKYAEHKLVYCCPSGIGLNTEAGLGTEAAEIVVKLDDAYKDCRLTHLETLRKDLCQIFRIPLEVFPLEGVQPGSVCVIFQVPEFMKKEIFPLSEKQILALSELNYDNIQIYSVMCSEYSYDIREKQTYAGSDSGIGTFHSKVYPESDWGSDSGIEASYFVTKTMGLEYIKNLKDKFLQMSDKAIQLSTLSEMHMKAIEGDLESIVEMIENEAIEYNPMNRDCEGNTALHYAAGNGHLHVIKYFVEELGFNCTIEGRGGITPLHYAASMGHEHIVEYLLDFQQVEALCHDEHNCTPLHYACREGHIGVVKQLADNVEQYLGEMQECNSSCLDEDNLTPLHLAAVEGHLSVIEYLVKDKKCDSMCNKNIYDITPLHFAASNGHLEIVKFFIKNLNGTPETLDKFGHSALHTAALSGQLNVVEHLIEEEGYNPSCVNDFHYTLLHMAVMGEQPLPIFKYLILGKKCDPLCRDKNGNTPLHFAALVGHMEVVQFLISNINCPTEAYNIVGQSPLHSAAMGGQLNVVQHLIEKEGFNPSSSDVFSSTPLHYAAQNGYLSVVKYLSLYLKYNPSCKNLAVHFPLQPHHIELTISNLKLEYERYKIQSTYKASEKIKSPLSLIDKLGLEWIVNDIPESLTSNTLNVLQSAVVGGYLNVVQHLIIKEGHDPSCLDKHNNTLLHIAAGVGHLSIVEYLTLDKVCDPMSRNRNGKTPLHQAASSGQLEVVKFLIKNLNGKPGTLDKFGFNVLHTATKSGQLNIVEYLIEKEGYSPSCVDDFHHTLLHIAAMGRQPLPILKYLILRKKCDPLCMNRIGNTPLYYAALFGHMEAVQFLISNINCPTKAILGESPLHAAAIGGHLNIVQHLIEKEGFDPSSPDASDITPLHYAISFGHLPVVEYLLPLNQDPVSKDAIVHTPLHHDHMEMIVSNQKTLLEAINEDHSAHHSAKEFDILMKAISYLKGVGLENIISSLKHKPEKLLFSSNQNLLQTAVESGHLNIVKYLIKEGHDPSCLDEYNRTLLHVAAGMGRLSIVKYLTLEQICDPMSRDIYGNTPLHTAAGEGHVEVLQFLISKMDHTQDILNNGGLNALHAAIVGGNLTTVQHLIEKEGYDISYLNADNDTPLHLAAANGHLSVVKYFILDKICDPMTKDKYGNIPLHHAAHNGHMEVLQFLISTMNCTSETLDNNGRNALHVAAMGGNLKIVQHLVEKERYSLSFLDAYDNTSLHLAAANGHLSVVKYLILDKACNPMCKKIDGNTPLHLAAHYGHMEVLQFLISNMNCTSETLNNNGRNPLHVVAMSGNLNIVQELIKRGYSLSSLDAYDNTSLHLAAANGHLSVVKYLILDKTCNPMCKNIDGNTPLHLAAEYGHMEVLQFLISNMNCTSEILNNNGRNALHVAATGGNLNIVQYLTEKEGYSPFLKDTCDRMPLHCAASSGHLETVKYLTNIYSCQDLNLLHNYAKHLPIHSAASGGNLETIKFLKQFNDLHSLYRDGWSCLHAAAEGGHLEAVRYFIEEHSFYPAIENYDQVTPLHLASWQGHLQVITYLIFEKECNPLCRDKSQDTPLHWAASEGQLETVKFFIEVLNLSPFIEGEDKQTVLGYAELYGHDKVVEYILSTLE